MLNRPSYSKVSDTLNTVINLEMEAKGLTVSFLAGELYEKLGYSSPPSACRYITMVKVGAVYGDGGPSARRNPFNLERLAILLFAIGFREDALIISKIRELDQRFQYPPTDGIPYEVIAEQRKIKFKRYPVELRRELIKAIKELPRDQLEILLKVAREFPKSDN